MKRFFFSGAAFILLSLAAKAQKQDTARLMVHYKFIHVTDVADPAHPLTENMALLIGKTSSVYRSYDGMKADEQFRASYLKAKANSPDGNIMINRRGVGMRTQYFQYPDEQKMLTKENVIMTEYLIDGPMPAINWAISSDTATFGGLHCQKATAHFAGRDYVAWFSPDLPLRTGPWKLNGLPGVIVDARDTKSEVIFQFDGVEKVVFSEVKPIGGDNAPPILQGLDDNPNIIAPPVRAVKASQKDFDKLKAGMQKNPDAVLQGMKAANNGGPQGDIVIKMAPGGPAKNINPIELPEK